MNKVELLEYQLTRDDFDVTMNGTVIKYNSNIIKKILNDQAIVNRIRMVIKDKENEIKYMENQYTNVESESHKLHHSWKAKLDDLDMFKRFLI